MEGRACNESAFEAKRVMEASHTVVEIKIKTLDSQVYTCRVEKNVSVPDLKEQVALVTGVPSGSQRLICRGKVLKDEHALSAYEVEDGHTLHLVTRPAPPPSASATPTGGQSEEQDPLDYSSLNRPGHISHSVLVGTFNIPDRGNVVFPEINRIFSSVLSSLRVGSFFPPAVGIGNGNTASVPPSTASPFSGGQEREENADRRPEERTVDQPTTTTHQSGSGDVGLSIDGFPSLHGDAGFIGAIPAVSHVRIVHQIVPNALRTMSQHMNRMEQIFAANGRAQTSVPNVDARSQPNEQGQSSSGGDGDPAAWASTIRRIQDLLSNQAGSELRRLADQLEAESSIETASARGNILSTGMLLEQLGRLLLDLGGTTLTRGRETSQQGGGLDLRTEMASRQGAEPMHYVDGVGDDIPGNMDIHIHAGLPPFLVARNFLSQAVQDGPSLSLNIDGTRDSPDFRHDQAMNGNTSVFMQPSSLGAMPPPASLNEDGAVRVNVPELFHNPSSLESANAGRGVFYPLLARFQQLNPSLFSRQEELSLNMSGTEEGSSAHRDPNFGQHHYPSLSVLQAVVQNQVGQVVGDGEAGFAAGEQLIPATSLHLDACDSQPEIGITRNGVSSTNSTVGSDVCQDLVRPLLHVLEAQPTVAGSQEQPKSDQAHANKELLEQADAETSLQLKCSGQTSVNMAWPNCASKRGTSLVNDHNAASVPIVELETSSSEVKEIKAVSGEFPADGLQPFSCRTRLCDQLRHQACTRESQDCARMEEVNTTISRGTVLQDFLSTLACRRDERSDSELASDQIPQELSLVLDNVENRGFCLDSLGSNGVEVTPLPSPGYSAESSKQQGSREIGLDTLGASSGLHNFQDSDERIATRNNSRCSLEQATSREDSKDLRHLFPVAHISNRQFLNDSAGLNGNHLEDNRVVANGGLFGTGLDNERLLKLQVCFIVFILLCQYFEACH
eukprot:c21585_g1_i2 orf=114-2987(+)